MIKEAMEKLLALAPPNIHLTSDGYKYTDKRLDLIKPPMALAVATSTLQGFVDLYEAGLDDVKAEDVIVHITSPTSVELISRESDKYGFRRS